MNQVHRGPNAAKVVLAHLKIAVLGGLGTLADSIASLGPLLRRSDSGEWRRPVVIWVAGCVAS
jgi:hypothetical protein